MAFFEGGALLTPWGTGTYHPSREAGEESTVILNFAGADHKVTVDPCHKFESRRVSDGQVVQGWVQLGQQAHSGCPW